MPPINNTYGLYTLMMFARMNGGGEKSIEPGFKVMKDEVNANVLAYEPSPGKMTELFQSGQAVLAVWGSGRVQSFANTGFPVDFVYPKEGAVTLLASACPVEKANASPLASEFIKAMLEPSLQLILLKDYGYGPVNKTVQVPAGARQHGAARRARGQAHQPRLGHHQRPARGLDQALEPRGRAVRRRDASISRAGGDPGVK